MLQEGEHITTIFESCFQTRVSADIEGAKGRMGRGRPTKDSDMYPGIKNTQ